MVMEKEERKCSEKGWASDRRPHFFKIVYHDQSKEHFSIPPNFKKHLKKGMSNRASLKCCSSGKFWNIQDGWQQFLEDKSLGNGEFLLFQYDGDMCFNVQIFETNGCEIVEKSGCEGVDMSVIKEHQQFAVPEVKRKRGRPKNFPPPFKCSCGDALGQSHHKPHPAMYESVKQGKGILRNIKDKDGTDLSFQEVDSEVKNFGDTENLQKKIRTGLGGDEEDAAGSKRVAKSFYSGFPYFQVRLTSASVDKVLLLNIPSSFSRAHLQNTKTKISLHRHGKTWQVSCIPSGGHNCFSAGWGAFVRDNNLKMGDNCIFELVGRKEMEVNIIRM